MEDLDHSRKGEVERTQAKNGKHVGRVDDERFTCDSENGRDRVCREQQVGRLDQDKDNGQRCCISNALTHHEKLLALKIVGQAEELSEEPQNDVLLGLNLGFVLPKQLDAAVDQDRSKHVDQP